MECAEAYFFCSYAPSNHFPGRSDFVFLTTLITESVFLVMCFHVMQMAISLDFFTFQSDEWR